jgi:hypothetical protein
MELQIWIATNRRRLAQRYRGRQMAAFPFSRGAGDRTTVAHGIPFAHSRIYFGMSVSGGYRQYCRCGTPSRHFANMSQMTVTQRASPKLPIVRSIRCTGFPNRPLTWSGNLDSRPIPSLTTFSTAPVLDRERDRLRAIDKIAHRDTLIRLMRLGRISRSKVDGRRVPEARRQADIAVCAETGQNR